MALKFRVIEDSQVKREVLDRHRAKLEELHPVIPRCRSTDMAPKA